MDTQSFWGLFSGLYVCVSVRRALNEMKMQDLSDFFVECLCAFITVESLSK